MAESSAYARRGFSGAATASTLSSGISSSATSIPCASLTTWSTTYTNGPATAILTEGTTVEIVEYTGISGSSLTGVTRGVGGTTASAFSAGATVEHGSRDRDYNEANYTANETVGKVTTAGDILVADGANSLDRLAIGSARQNLSVNSGATGLTYTASLQSLLTATGDIVYASSANTPARLAATTDGHVVTLVAGVPAWAAAAAPTHGGASVATSETTTSTTYTDLATVGPAVTVSTGTKALVIVSGGLDQSVGTGNPYMSFAVSGATTLAADDVRAFATTSSAGASPNGYLLSSRVLFLTGLTAGSNTFTAKYRTNSGTGRFEKRDIFVMNLGS